MTFDMHTAWAIPTFSNLADFVPSMLASGANPLGHVLDKESALGDYLGFKVKLSAVSIVVAAILTFAALYIASRRIDTGSANEGAARYLTRGRISQLIEVMVQGIRDGALEPSELCKYFYVLLTMLTLISGASRQFSTESLKHLLYRCAPRVF